MIGAAGSLDRGALRQDGVIEPTRVEDRPGSGQHGGGEVGGSHQQMLSG